MEDHVEELKKFKGEGRITTLTPEVIWIIKERYRDGATVYRISKELGIRKDTCRKVIYNTFSGERSREKVDAVKVEGFISPQEKQTMFQNRNNGTLLRPFGILRCQGIG